METFHRLTLSDLLSLYWDWIPALSLRPVQLLSSRTHKMRLFLSRNERYRTNRTQELSNYDLWFPPPSLMLTNEIRPLPKVSERRVCLFYPLYTEDVRGWRYKKNPFFFRFPAFRFPEFTTRRVKRLTARRFVFDVFLFSPSARKCRDAWLTLPRCALLKRLFKRTHGSDSRLWGWVLEKTAFRCWKGSKQSWGKADNLSSIWAVRSGITGIHSIFTTIPTRRAICCETFVLDLKMASSRIFNVRPVLSVNSVRRELLSKPYPVHWSMMHIVYRVLIYRLSIWMRLGVFLASVGSTTGIWSVLIKALKKPQMYFINPPPPGLGKSQWNGSVLWQEGGWKLWNSYCLKCT